MSGNTFENRAIASEAGKKSRRGPAKLNTEVKGMISNLIENLYEDVIDNLDDLNTREKAQLLAKLFEYDVPKMRAIAATFENKEPLVIIFQNASKEYEFDKNGKSIKKIPCESEG